MVPGCQDVDQPVQDLAQAELVVAVLQTGKENFSSFTFL